MQWSNLRLGPIRITTVEPSKGCRGIVLLFVHSSIVEGRKLEHRYPDALKVNYPATMCQFSGAHSIKSGKLISSILVPG